MAGQIKAGMKFRWNPDDCTIIERQDDWILAKLVSDNGLVCWDISRVQHTPYGEEMFMPSLNKNGLYEPYVGSTKVPTTFDAMKIRFDEVVANTRKEAEAKANSAQAREEAANTRLLKITAAKELKATAEGKIVEIMSTARNIEKAVQNPILQEAVQTIETVNRILPYIR